MEVVEVLCVFHPGEHKADMHSRLSGMRSDLLRFQRMCHDVAEELSCVSIEPTDKLLLAPPPRC